MPDFADSSGAVIAIIAESTFDTTPASPGFQKLRFTSESLNYTPNRVTSNEITANAGVSDLVEVGAQNAGDISFEWSYGADFDILLQGSLRATFTAGTVTQGVTVTGVEAIGQTTIGVTTDGTGDVSLVLGDIVYFAGELQPYVMTAAATIGISSSGDLNIDPPLRVALSGAEVVTAANAVNASNGKNSYTIEKMVETGSPDQYLRFTGSRLNTMSMTVSPGGIATGAVGIMGAGHSTGTAILSGATYTEANTNPVLAAPSAANVFVGGTTTALYFTELSWNLNNNLRAQEAVSYLTPQGVGYGRREISGTMNAYFEDLDLYDLFVAGTETELAFEMDDGTNKYTVWFPRVKMQAATVNLTGISSDVMTNVTFQPIQDDVTGVDMIVIK